jgi:hypothetical protein
MVIGIAAYFLLSAVVLRWFPASEDQAKTPEIISAQTQADNRPVSINRPASAAPIKMDRKTASGALNGAIQFSPRILANAVNRMALAPPFYYDMRNLTSDCQPAMIRMWLKRNIKCEPTHIVYSRLFGNDGFSGIGTAPAASNIYGYALAGWPGAVISTIFMMTVLGLFLAIWKPAQTRPVFAAAFVMGCYTAYFFGQLPIEGPIIYDHGMIWWVLLVLGWTSAYWVYLFVASSLSQRRQGAA